MLFNIQKEISACLANVGTPVTLRWREWVGTPTIDPVTKSKIGTSTQQTETVNGLFYEVGASNVERRFAEIQKGDAILDLPPSVTVNGRDQLEFVINGREWVMKEVGGELAETWDATLPVNTGAQFEIPKSGMTADASSVYMSSDDYAADNAIDGIEVEEGNVGFWHNNVQGENPAYLRVNLGQSYLVSQVTYLPRPNCFGGTFNSYEIYITENPSTALADWGDAVASGTWTWEGVADTKTVSFTPKRGRYVIFRCVSGVDGFASCNEVSVYAVPHNMTFMTVLLRRKT